MISERTKAPLAAAKKRGQRLGNPGIAEVAKRGRTVASANARRFAANVRPIIEEIMRAGVTSHNAIAAKLNERGVKTARGGVWTHVQVGAILRPFEGYVESVGTGRNLRYSNELQKRIKRSVPSVSRGRSVVAISPL